MSPDSVDIQINKLFQRLLQFVSLFVFLVFFGFLLVLFLLVLFIDFVD